MNTNRVKPAPGIPATAQYHYNYNDRHIINDGFNRTIYIQVLHGYDGGLKKDEYARIKSGMFWEFIPEHLLQNIKQAIDAGFKVQPAFINGYNSGSGHIVYQLIPITDGKPMLEVK